MLVWSAVTFLVLGTFIIQAGRNRAPPQAAVLKDLPAANLLGSYSLGSVENDIDSPEPVPEQDALAMAGNEELQPTTEKKVSLMHPLKRSYHQVKKHQTSRKHLFCLQTLS